MCSCHLVCRLQITIVIISFLGQYNCILFILVDIQPHNFSFEYDTIASEDKYWCEHLACKDKQYRHANSSSCTTTELSKLLTSCLTAVKNHVIRYCEKVYERSGKTLFWSIKNSDEVLNKLKSRGFRATSLSTYDFATFYTTLPII